ncbi:MFS transporter [Hahella sp. CCB-MM4]|uniref:MFS transporter n=1 Tax=Hahella sp. (strain CCB-MM4) TaxID=1926491 RepID=UPI000B9A8F0E|nr:MFS transporter [Hahella sp. CCB-MM4]OZG72089.1 MFS transporter [Hahella sp. CCB-MM4]
MIESGSRAFWRGTLAMYIGSFMVFANVWMPQPLLPVIAQQFELTTLQVSTSFSVTTLMLGLSLLVYGPVSDALGRKGIILLTMTGAMATTFLLSQAGNFQELLLLRALQGFFLGGLPAIAIAYLGEEYRPDAVIMAVGLYISGNTLGGIGGRLIGGFVGEWMGLSWSFGLMGTISLLCLLIFMYLLPRPQHFSPKPLRLGTAFKDLGAHLRNPLLLTCFMIGGLNFFIFINQYSYITFVLKSEPYSLSSKYIGLLFLTYLTGTFGSAISGRIAKRLSQPVCIALGTSILMLGSAVTLIPSISAIITGLLINCFGFFLAHSSASSLVNAKATTAKASASSLYLTFYYLGASTGSLYLDPFWQHFGWTGVVAGSWIVLSVVLVAALLLYRKTERHMKTGQQKKESDTFQLLPE